MSPLSVIAIIVIVIGIPVALYAFRRHARATLVEIDLRPRPPRWPMRLNRYISERAIDLYEEAAEGWWSNVWGPTHVDPDPPYDWQAERPPAVVGSGRGHAL